MKRWVGIFLILCLCFSMFVGCGETKTESSQEIKEDFPIDGEYFLKTDEDFVQAINEILPNDIPKLDKGVNVGEDGQGNDVYAHDITDYLTIFVDCDKDSGHISKIRANTFNKTEEWKYKISTYIPYIYNTLQPNNGEADLYKVTELVESCERSILEDKGMSYFKDIGKLVYSVDADDSDMNLLVYISY